jgi:hypothetical protein
VEDIHFCPERTICGFPSTKVSETKQPL